MKIETLRKYIKKYEIEVHEKSEELEEVSEQRFCLTTGSPEEIYHGGICILDSKTSGTLCIYNESMYKLILYTIKKKGVESIYDIHPVEEWN